MTTTTGLDMPSSLEIATPLSPIASFMFELGSVCRNEHFSNDTGASESPAWPVSSQGLYPEVISQHGTNLPDVFDAQDLLPEWPGITDTDIIFQDNPQVFDTIPGAIPGPEIIDVLSASTSDTFHPPQTADDAFGEESHFSTEKYWGAQVDLCQPPVIQVVHHHHHHHHYYHDYQTNPYLGIQDLQ